MKVFPVFLFLALFLCVSSHAYDLAFYSGHPNPDWYSEAQMLDDVDKIINGVKGKFKEVKSFDDKAFDDFKAWTEKNMDDGELDIIWLNGCMPSVLYPNPNVQRDGSLAEEWLDHGNMLINVADWFGYCTYETGARGADNGGTGAESILDLPGIIISSDNTAITITDAGEEYLPSLGKNITIDRPISRAAVRDPWEIAEVFGESGNNLDPVVIYNKDTEAYVAFINQGNLGHSVDRAQVTIEFINNWLAEKLGFVAVESLGKLATRWGAIK